MALADDMRSLRDRVLADLNAAYDYYSDTKLAWDIVDQFVAAGNTFVIKNTATGTQTTQTDLAGKAKGYVAQHLAEATFQQFVAMLENFIFDFLRLWLKAYPQSLGAKTVTLRAIMDALDKDAIIMLAIEHELNEVMYKRPADWFEFIDARVKLGCPTPDEIGRIAEAKATRDILAHSRGIANAIYESKAGAFARCKAGDRIDISEPYHRDTWQLIRKVVTDMSNAASAKAP